jgi:mannose-6-phosphate isomerase
MKFGCQIKNKVNHEPALIKYFMKTIRLLENTIQEYAWGSTTAIPALRGIPNPENKPQAEVWMGAHPKAPSRVFHEGRSRSLLEMIEKHPLEMLGQQTLKVFGNQLPFLFKILAAEKPLSIQAHPNSDQAKAGFKRENQLYIPMDAQNRNYKDQNHKPECICALSSFWALNGFRPIERIVSYLEILCPDALAQEIGSLKQIPDSHTLKKFYQTLLTLPEDRKKTTLNATVSQARKWIGQDPVYEWILRLFEEYPLDAGILSPALFNLVCLKPGEALYLPAGRLHAYLEGLGIEVMANSDNVLRGGCTPKHMDVAELLNVVDFEPTRLEILEPLKGTSRTESFYPTPAREFQLSLITISKGLDYHSPGNRGIEILLCTEGKADLDHPGDQLRERKPLRLTPGESVVVPAAAEAYRLRGKALLYKATVTGSSG